MEAGGTPRDHRFSHRFEPAIAAGAHLLTVTIPRIAFVRFDPASPTLGREENWPGPWTFEVPLAASSQP
jgi:hypothetical protein